MPITHSSSRTAHGLDLSRAQNDKKATYDTRKMLLSQGQNLQKQSQTRRHPSKSGREAKPKSESPFPLTQALKSVDSLYFIYLGDYNGGQVSLRI
ncbi:hypothetical protein L3X38_033371 [Prunus dulcis]|uniref:Uncharacterized protein n=1 Tax=Prunus dulcis TaxID=3755 RepID=A0AAD4VGY2_PRUDU|nr:hypothetical protein L3X38_033371 [Prunus dulcis]